MSLEVHTLPETRRHEHLLLLPDDTLPSRASPSSASPIAFHDEDVNVYLALLLNSIVTDRFHRAAPASLRGMRSCEILDRKAFMRSTRFR
jgi:hypothetical protein